MSLQKKPPVVAIMGHVDHGKTTLLDFIRKSKLAAKEVGEITQATAAYQIEHKGEKITFIDTPGHAAFSQMRRRGAKVADIVVLVVAANDGVMPQTKESIKIIKEAKVPFIVAINKIDLPEAAVDKVKTQLAEDEVLVEGYGGKVVAVPLSAKTGEGVDQLLEMILLTAEMEGLKADPEGEFKAEIIESKADKFCGSIASLMVENGTLKKGMEISADGVTAKVRMLKNDLGESIEKALPGDPALVLGFCHVPQVGALVITGGSDKTEEAGAAFAASLVNPKEESKLKIILKTDVAGSLEAILSCLPSEIEVVRQGIGEINESDVLSAKNLKAEIYTFNLSISGSVEELAETEGVKIKNYRIIYDLLKDLEGRVLKIIAPTIDRKILGKAEILAVFEMKGEKIAGAKVLEGKINKKGPVMIKRGEAVVGETKIVSMREQKQDINEAGAGMEFGLVFSGKVDFEKGDMVLSYSLEEK